MEATSRLKVHSVDTLNLAIVTIDKVQTLTNARRAQWRPTMLSIPEMYVVGIFVRAISIRWIVRHESFVVRTETAWGYSLCSVGVLR